MEYKEASIIRIEESGANFEEGQEGPEESKVLNKIILQTCDDQQQMEIEVEEKWLRQMGLNEGMRVNLLIHTDGTAMIQKWLKSENQK